MAAEAASKLDAYIQIKHKADEEPLTPEQCAVAAHMYAVEVGPALHCEKSEQHNPCPDTWMSGCH